MADPGASGPAKRVVRVDDGVWKSRLTTGVKLRFVAWEKPPRGWVQLPQPWGGSVAVFTGGPEEVREAHLSGLDPFAPLEYTQEILRDNGIPPLELRSLPSREVKNV
ncbi:hypothetical protein ABPG75_003245, partial [Micractinium tetrahymenae]